MPTYLEHGLGPAASAAAVVAAAAVAAVAALAPGLAPGTNVLVLKANVASGVVTGTLTPAPMGGGRGRRGGGGGGGGDAAATPPPAPTPVNIVNGKISGNELTFDVTRAGRAGGPDITMSYKATVSADLKTLTGVSATPVAFTATKQ